MKYCLFLFCLPFFILACNKSDEEIIPSGNQFSETILEGFDVVSIAFDNEGNAWIGTYNWAIDTNYPELIKYNRKSTEIQVYNSTNSLIEDGSFIWDIAVDDQDNIWIGSDGLVKFDGTNFSKFTTKNSDIPVGYVHDIIVDSNKSVWFSSSSHLEGGLVKYDGTSWTVYTPENSDLPYNGVRSVAIDREDNIWLALYRTVNESALVKIDKNNWTVYDSNNFGFTPYLFGNIQINSKNQVCASIDYTFSDVPHNGPQFFIFDEISTQKIQYDNELNITRIVTDEHDTIWGIGTNVFVIFDGEKWIVDDTTFKDLYINTIERSPDKKIWIGTSNGIYIYG
ncbi:MAG: two-component regulator propeller domain-containing protein [Mangrovibacterium sp.]